MAMKSYRTVKLVPCKHRDGEASSALFASMTSFFKMAFLIRHRVSAGGLGEHPGEMAVVEVTIVLSQHFCNW